MISETRIHKLCYSQETLASGGGPTSKTFEILHTLSHQLSVNLNFDYTHSLPVHRQCCSNQNWY